jgi:hypothetical protein
MKPWQWMKDDQTNDVWEKINEAELIAVLKMKSGQLAKDD